MAIAVPGLRATAALVRTGRRMGPREGIVDRRSTANVGPLASIVRRDPKVIAVRHGPRAIAARLPQAEIAASIAITVAVTAPVAGVRLAKP